jgi:uncharacterized protein (DUF2249 family)
MQMSDVSEQSATTGDTLDILDVRKIPPAQRHPLIFQRFLALPEGGAFTLVNDHDPKPLYYQLNFEYSGQLGWDYLEQGPQVWRVRISRIATTSSQKHIPLRPAPPASE